MDNTEEKEKKNKKTNVIAMVVLILAFIIGIATRWGYIKEEVVDSTQRYRDAFKDMPK